MELERKNEEMKEYVNKEKIQEVEIKSLIDEMGITGTKSLNVSLECDPELLGCKTQHIENVYEDTHIKEIVELD